ncbi:threonine synthase [Candidatus Epulonipiscioides saccharophilum]|nr:threonine synthase [Epulopiscium sp. SCG-B10WGA-EpuloB]
MFYSSTRGDNNKVSSAEAIIKGLAPDKGLFTPDNIPILSAEEKTFIKTASYKEVAKLIFSKFLTDFSDKEISTCVDSAYNNFDVAPLHQLDEQTQILELWHGPTCAFKDVALQILPYFLTTAMSITGEQNDIAILVATSGDTGKAALEGFKDVAGTKIIVLYPSEGVSAVQKQQMVTQEGDNVSVIAINGNFDDAQTAAKNIFTDNVLNATLLSKGIKLSSANSINWGRLLPQIVYYIKSSIDLGEATIDYVVPTGNFGNILAAYFAKQMGAPIGKLICASNSNNVLSDFIQTGIYDRRREFFKTLSPSMDILISSNLERLLYELSGHNAPLISKLMADLEELEVYTIPDDLKTKLDDLFYPSCTDDLQTKHAIKDCYDKFGYLLDTHTAVAYNAYQKYTKEHDSKKIVIVSTASPYKFPIGVGDALGLDITKNEYDILKDLENLTHVAIPKPLVDLQSKEVLHSISCRKEEILQAVTELL